MSSDELVLVLVHGTKPQLFGRQLLAPPTWARPQSTFRKSLEASLSERPVFVEFAWSGANTHHARLEAGARLAGQLRQLRDEYPLARLVVIAHSHGGNVASYAVRQLDPANRADPHPVDGLVCLGTPFLRAKLRDVGWLLARLYVSGLYAVPISWMVLLILFALLFRQLSEGTFMTFLVIGMVPLVLWKNRGARWLAHYFTDERTRRLATKARDMTAAVDAAPIVHGPRTFVVKSQRDEAKLWLTLMDRSASVFSGDALFGMTSRMIVVAGEIQEWLKKHKWSVTLPLALVILPVANGWFGADLTGRQAERLVLLPVLLMVLLSLVHLFVFIVVVLLLRGSTFSFGQGLFLSLVASVSTSADRADGGYGQSEVLTVTLPATVFHHASFYADASTIRAIGQWIDAGITGLTTCGSAAARLVQTTPPMRSNSLPHATRCSTTGSPVNATSIDC